MCLLSNETPIESMKNLIENHEWNFLERIKTNAELAQQIGDHQPKRFQHTQ